MMSKALQEIIKATFSDSFLVKGPLSKIDIVADLIHMIASKKYDKIKLKWTYDKMTIYFNSSIVTITRDSITNELK